MTALTEVRLITEADIAGFHAALSSVALEQKFLAFTESPPLEGTREFVMENIVAGIPQYVAIEQGSLVGWCDISPKSQRPVFRHTGVLGMGVIAAARGRGVGSQLIEATLAHARRFGLERIELQVFTSNLGAIKLYQRFGFVIEGTHPKHARFVDRYEDSHSMALLL